MQITFLALGSRGDIQPYATLGAGLRSLGYRVSFITTENFGPLIEQHKLAFHPIPGDAQAIVTDAGPNMLALVRSFGALARGFAEDIPTFKAVFNNTDALINQLPLAMYGYDLAERYGIPMIVAAVIPLSRTEAFPAMGFPTLPFPGYNKATYHIAEQLGWQLFRRAVNRWREGILGLPRTPLRGYFDQLGTRQHPILYGFSPHIVAQPADWGEHIHLTGYWFPQTDTWQPPEALHAFLEEGPPPVFFGFGSMPIRNPTRTTEIVLAALEETGLRGVIHTGWTGMGAHPLPPTVMAIDYAPYAWLFPRMGVIVHHGGSGTTAFGLRAGIPSLVLPFLFDQFYWGERIAALGVGPSPIPFRRLSPTKLAQVIDKAYHDPGMQQRAAELGDKIQAERGVETAVRLIDHYLHEKGP